MNDIEFAGGDDILQPIRLMAGDIIPVITGGTLSGAVQWRGQDRIALAVGSGIENVNTTPGELESHCIVRLTSIQTPTIPMGRVATLLMRLLTPTGFHVTFDPIYLKRIA